MVRGVQVMLDRDLAVFYKVETGQLNRQVKRNIGRFPEDFMFQLTKEEWEALKCQIGISNVRGGDRRALPYVFTEQGVSQLSGVLHNDLAETISVRIIRAFVAMRQAINVIALPSKLSELEKSIEDLRTEVDEILADQNEINESTRAQLDAISTALAELQSKEPRKRRPIGFILPNEKEK
jgi:hypothetical protein